MLSVGHQEAAEILHTFRYCCHGNVAALQRDSRSSREKRKPCTRKPRSHKTSLAEVYTPEVRFSLAKIDMIRKKDSAQQMWHALVKRVGTFFRRFQGLNDITPGWYWHSSELAMAVNSLVGSTPRVLLGAGENRFCGEIRVSGSSLVPVRGLPVLSHDVLVVHLHGRGRLPVPKQCGLAPAFAREKFSCVFVPHLSWRQAKPSGTSLMHQPGSHRKKVSPIFPHALLASNVGIAQQFLPSCEYLLGAMRAFQP